MKHLIYDTETTGLPIDYKAHVHEVDNWPRLVQLAWMVIDDDFETLTYRNHIINPYGKFIIPDGSSEIHGITNEEADKKGVHIMRALLEFQVAQSICDVQVGHNVNFDRKVIGAEFIRRDMEDAYQRGKDMPRICTMFKTTKLVGLKKNNRPKWPTLQELHCHLFGETFDNAHNACGDVQATVRCYKELVEGGLI